MHYIIYLLYGTYTPTSERYPLSLHDALPISLGHRWQRGGRNSPTVLNAVFNTAQFWDGRAADLAEQAGGPIENPVERSEEHTSELQSRGHLVCRLLLEKKKY